jgi:methylated-DNA-protein-cysteine methyltransferase-like protein
MALSTDGLERGASVLNPFTLRVLDIIKQIPEGRVMTYGQIARWAGSPRGARQLVRILHSLSRAHRLPWHRVVNAKGAVALRDDEARSEQMMLLSSEGVEVDRNGCIDLERYLHEPEL